MIYHLEKNMPLPLAVAAAVPYVASFLVTAVGIGGPAVAITCHLHSKNEEKNGEVKKLKELVSDLESKKHTEKVKVAGLKEINSRKNDIIKKMGVENKNIQDELTSNKQILAPTKEKLTSTEKELTSTKEKLTSTDKELTSTKEKLTSTKEKLASKEEKLKDLLKQYNKDKKELTDNFNAQLASLTKNYLKISESAQKKHEEVLATLKANHQREITAIQEEVTRLTAQLEDSGKAIAGLTAQAQRSEAAIARLTEQAINHEATMVATNLLIEEFKDMLKTMKTAAIANSNPGTIEESLSPAAQTLATGDTSSTSLNDPQFAVTTIV